MIGFDINQAKGMFFDRRAVTTPIERAAKRVMGEFGKRVRTTAKKSIKKAKRKKLSEMTPWERRVFRIQQSIGKRQGFKARKPYKASRPGEPSAAHKGLIKKHIYYLWDAAKKSVIVGPARLPRTGGANQINVLEFGGTTRATRGEDKGKHIRIDPRPTMQLARNERLPELENLWKDSVR